MIHRILVASIVSAATYPLFALAQPPASPLRTATAQKPGELLVNGNFANGLSPWTMEENSATGKAEVVPEGPDGKAALRVKVVTVGDASWRLQVYYPKLGVKKGQKYTLTYWVKAERAGVITVNCMQNHAPWEHHAAAAEVPVTTKWTPQRFNFDGPWDDTNARITFTNLGTAPGQAYWFANCSLKETPGEKRVDKKPAPPVAVKPAGTPTGGALHTVANRLEDDKGRAVRLQGVNVPSLDWSPTGDHLMPSLDAALGAWNAKVIRIPLTQDLWFGYYKGTRAQDGGQAYRKLVDSVVKKIVSKNAYVLLDLHWSDCGKWGQNVGQHAMPDDNSVLFWKDCAARYANQPAVLFDLYNEPHSVPWSVWKNGGEVTEGNGIRYHSPGMQALLDTVRSTGAKNLVVAGGLDWAYDLRGILDGHALTDKKGSGIMYGTHLYPWKKDWDANVTPVATQYPVFVGEVGTKPWKQGDPPHENVYTETWAPEVIAYITKHQLSWTAWSFHPSANPCLLTGWDYQPTAYWGAYVKTALGQSSKNTKK